MEDSLKARIWIIGHKDVPYGWYEDNALYEPLQVGFGDRYATYRDSDGKDNKAQWNAVMAECTGTYYIWKYGLVTDYVGQCQYRRRIYFKEHTDFDAIFADCDVIAAKPLMLGRGNVYNQYAFCHNKKDLDDAKAVIDERFPWLSKDYDEYILHGRKLYYSNSFVMPKYLFDSYCRFLFTVLEGIRERRGWKTPEDAVKEVDEDMKAGRRPKTRGLNYQCQVLAFLSERLWTMWVQAYRVKEMDYTKFEGV